MNTGVVIYTDGGAEPPVGPGGSGLFGYTFEIGKSITPALLKDTYYPSSEGYYQADTLPKGAYWVEPIEELHGGIAFPMPVTNNIAELSAAVKALEEIVNKKWTYACIRPDSRYFMDNYLNTLETWAKNRWTISNGDPVKNQVIWERLLELKKELADLGIEPKLVWVKGHQKEPGNVRADALATLAKESAKLAKSYNRLEYGRAALVDTVEERTKVPEYNRMFDSRRWYFTNNGSEDRVNEHGFNVYYLGAHGKDDALAGKLMAEGTYSVLWTKEPEPVLEKVREHQIDLSRGAYGEFVIGDLDVICSKKIYEDIYVNGTFWYPVLPYTKNIVSLDTETLLTTEAKPAGLMLYAAERLMRADQLLAQFYRREFDEGSLTDVTDQLFDVTVKGEKETYKLSKDITTAAKVVPLKFELPFGDKDAKTTEHLMLGTDLPKRNTLSALAKRGCRVYVYTKRLSNNSFWFCSFVESAGDMGIWMGEPANVRILK